MKNEIEILLNVAKLIDVLKEDIEFLKFENHKEYKVAIGIARSIIEYMERSFLDEWMEKTYNYVEEKNGQRKTPDP